MCQRHGEEFARSSVLTAIKKSHTESIRKEGAESRRPVHAGYECRDKWKKKNVSRQTSSYGERERHLTPTTLSSTFLWASIREKGGKEKRKEQFTANRNVRLKYEFIFRYRHIDGTGAVRKEEGE